MLEVFKSVFKVLVLSLVSVLITIFTSSWLYTCALFFLLVIVFYDFDFTIELERHAIGKIKHSYLKVRNFYTAIFQSDQYSSSYLYTPTMNSINKQTSNLELSRFNKSGNALSPISNSASSGSLGLSSRRLIQSRQTSTPLTKTSPWQKNSISSSNNVRTATYQNSMVNHSPRYSLSSVNNIPKSDSIESPSRPTIQTVTGPLLASTRFNVNLGTYTDTKSPGLASRVVQYHNELSGSQSSTHQAKYGSPGQFPIVQLYKKELPILARTPRKCTVRIAPLDPLPYNSEQANAILRDSFVQNNIETTGAQGETEINTRSVLEALKEISRKRIHSNDDIDDITKRQRKNSSTPSSSSDQVNKDGKRMREDTPPKPKEVTCTTPIISAPKRICVVNEIESSLSSSRLMRLQNQGQKRKAALNTPINTTKQRRISNGELVSRQTQTTIMNGSTSSSTDTRKKSTAAQTEEVEHKKVSRDVKMKEETSKTKPAGERSIAEIDKANSKLRFKTRNTNPSRQIFSETPLDIMRKNKLQVMLSALGGHEPKIIPLPNMLLSAMNNAEDKTDGSAMNNKGVVSILSPKNKAKHDKHVTFAISATSVSEDSNDASANTATDKPSEASANVSLPNIQLNFSSPSTVATRDSGTSSDKPPMLNTSLPFSIPSSSVSLSSPISFGTTTSNTTVSGPLPFSSPTSPSTGYNSFTSPPNTFAFGSNICSPSSQTPMRSMSSSLGTITSTTSMNNTISSSDEKSPGKPSINLGTGQGNLSFGSPAFDASNMVKAPAFGGLVPSTSNSSTTTAVSSAPATTSAINFSFPAASKSTTTATAPIVTSGAAMFGSTATTSASALSFVAPASSAQSNSSVQPITFGGAKPPAFSAGNTATTSASININFGATSAQPTSMFPAVTTVSFGVTAPIPASAAAPSAGGLFNFAAKTEAKTATTSSSAAFSFGPTTTASPSQPKSGGFKFDLGKPATASGITVTKVDPAKPAVFGGSGNSMPTKPGAFTFGAANTPSSASAFGTPTTTQNSAFGTPNTVANSGGFGTPTTTANTGMFGTPNTTTSTPAFGAPNTVASPGVFGAANANTGAFGSPSTTANTGGFGTPSTTASAGVFGTPSTTSSTGIFGAGSTSTPTFGATKPADNPPAFGSFGTPSSAQNTGFGNFSTPTTTQSSSAFGGFGTPTTQSNAFGSTPATTASTFAFGGNTTAAKPFAFGDATTTTTAAPTMFGSTAPATNTANPFGGAASSGFGRGTTGTTNAFGSSTTTTTIAGSTFGQQTAGNVFGTASSGFGQAASGSVFGGASSNNNASNNNNNAFGSSSTPSAFGTPTQQTSTFGSGTPNQGNVFAMNNANQAPPAFGATNTNQSNTFGATANTSFGGGFGGSTTPATGFGSFGSPAPNVAPAPQSGVFAFGGSAPAANPAPAASNAFQFGNTSTPAKSSGFNFSGSANTPNNNFSAGGAAPGFGPSPATNFGTPNPGGFNAAPGMFSIGSGSTAPKQRQIIKARRRN